MPNEDGLDRREFDMYKEMIANKLAADSSSHNAIMGKLDSLITLVTKMNVRLVKVEVNQNSIAELDKKVCKHKEDVERKLDETDERINKVRISSAKISGIITVLLLALGSILEVILRG